ncbi:MAG: BMP family ABC transporter substrate-binding protein, partial [Methanoregula sp.]
MNRKYILAGALVGAVALLVCAVLITSPVDPSLPVVYMVYGGEKGDLSYIDSVYRGLFSAQEEMPFSKREFMAFDDGELEGYLSSAQPARPGLVIVLGYSYAEQTQSLADRHPDIRFFAIDQTGSGARNLRQYEITSYGESYLAGVLAATATKTRHVGIILGTQSSLLEGFRQGYRDGVRAADPGVVLEEVYVREHSTIGFSDPVRAAEIARAMYRNGTDVIYTVAGFSGTGAISEAKTTPGRYIIGVDSDQTALGPSVVLASAVKRVDRVVYTSISDYLNGSFTGGATVAGLDDGVTELVYNPRFAHYNTTVSTWEGIAT